MSAPDTAAKATSAAGAAPRLNEQIEKLQGHVQDLLREGPAAPPACKSSLAEVKPPASALPPLAPPKAAKPGKLSRFMRASAGAGLLVLAAWALLPLLFELRTTHARVNAPVVTLRSPIDGTVEFHCPTKSGATTNQGEALFEVRNSLADGDRLDSLKDEEAYVQSRIAGAGRQLSDLIALREDLSTTASEYRRARLRILQLECEAARAALENARAVKKQRDFEEDQMVQLQASRSVSKQDASAARCAADGAQQTAVQAEKNVEKLQEQIHCLRAGVQAVAGDGGNDLPYSTQRLHELDCRIEETRASLRQDEAKLAQLQRHIGAERERQSRRARFASTASKETVVWRRRVGDDTPIRADSPLLDLVNPSEVFIDAVIGESDLKRVQCGGAARVRLPGSRKEWKAVVKQVFGQELPWPDACLAAAAIPATQQEIHVVLSFTEPLADDNGAVSFPVGLPAEVTFVSTGEALRGLFARCGN